MRMCGTFAGFIPYSMSYFLKNEREADVYINEINKGDRQKLKEVFDEYLEKGYELHGHLKFDETYFYQVVIKH